MRRARCSARGNFSHRSHLAHRRKDSYAADEGKEVAVDESSRASTVGSKYQDRSMEKPSAHQRDVLGQAQGKDANTMISMVHEILGLPPLLHQMRDLH